MSSLNGVPASLQFIYVLLPSCKGWLLTLGMYLVAVAGVEGWVFRRWAYMFLTAACALHFSSGWTAFFLIDSEENAVLRNHVPSFASLVQICTHLVSEVEAKRPKGFVL